MNSHLKWEKEGFPRKLEKISIKQAEGKKLLFFQADWRTMVYSALLLLKNRIFKKTYCGFQNANTQLSKNHQKKVNELMITVMIKIMITYHDPFFFQP